MTYLTDAIGARVIERYQKSANIVVVDDPADTDGEVCRGAAELFRRHGGADVVFAASEYDLLTAARIRDKFGIAGMSESHTLYFRDKVHMKQRLCEAGIETPRFAECSSPAVVAEMMGEVGGPVVLKPRRGMGSRGIHIIADEAELARAWPLIDPPTYECEEFVPGPIYHIDGLVHAGRLVFGTASKYVNTCLQAQGGMHLGSFVVDDEILSRTLKTFAVKTTTALELDKSAFHLEVILRNGQTPVFLEIGARIGGGQIRAMTKDVYGVDLLREWVNLQLGEKTELRVNDHSVGGWLVAPAPGTPPYRVLDAEHLSDHVPCLYHEELPEPGELYDAARLRTDRWPGGRFRYAGPSSALVEHAITETIQRYRVLVSQ
ncbi:MAG TPA: ATP-grasp domain-containing protein [Streptosporangiaceae bacterium]|nr:ATP-grasp domain-containing protein [Streptosporangiaceae bacterium]